MEIGSSSADNSWRTPRFFLIGEWVQTTDMDQPKLANCVAGMQLCDVVTLIVVVTTNVTVF
jgi:hypothetical protein